MFAIKREARNRFAPRDISVPLVVEAHAFAVLGNAEHLNRLHLVRLGQLLTIGPASHVRDKQHSRNSQSRALSLMHGVLSIGCSKVTGCLPAVADESHRAS